MSNILIVDDNEEASQEVWPTYVAGADKGNAPKPEITSWSDFGNRVRESRPGDVMILNMAASGAPTFREAELLHGKQPEVGFVYVLDIKAGVRERALKSLNQPGVTWVSSTASDQEKRLRLRGLVSSMGQSAGQDVLDDQRSPWEHLMPELHNPRSGRLDATRISGWFGISVKMMAGLLGRGYATVHKTPDAVALQDKLNVFLRIASALSRLAGSHRTALVWLNAPNQDLEDGHTPLAVIESGGQEIIAELLEDAIAGQPG